MRKITAFQIEDENNLINVQINNIVFIMSTVKFWKKTRIAEQ